VYFVEVAVRPAKKRPPQQWDMVVVAPWTDASAIDQSRVVSGKRQRKSVLGNS
jgi:hypothetical protein